MIATTSSTMIGNNGVADALTAPPRSAMTTIMMGRGVVLSAVRSHTTQKKHKKRWHLAPCVVGTYVPTTWCQHWPTPLIFLSPSLS